MSEVVRIYRLITGEEIIAKTWEQDVSGGICVKQPRRIQVTQNEKKELGLQLMPYLFGAEDGSEVGILAKHIVASTEPEKELEKQYLQSTTMIKLVE